MPIIEWRPISQAPNNERLLLGWDKKESDPNDGYDWYVMCGSLVDGQWLDGPDQPNWWAHIPRPPQTSPTNVILRDALAVTGFAPR
jgi:hypothetical protein